MRRHTLPSLILVLFLAGPARAEEPVPNRPKVPGRLKLHLRERRPEKPGANTFKVVERTVEWEVGETAVIVCDMWDDHFCKAAAQRVAAMAPKMNRVLTAARDHGVQIIHAPSGTLYIYEGTPHRLRLTQPKPAKPPVPILPLCDVDPKREPPLPVDVSKCACDDPVVGPYVRRFSRQHPALDITGYDGISDSGAEVYNFFHQEGIKNVVLMGVHTNMCVLGRSFGIRQMVRLGMNVVLARDLTDAMYDPRQPPYVSHTRGTEMVVEHIETYWCPSIKSKDLTRVVPGSAGPVAPKKTARDDFPRLKPLEPAEAARSFRTRAGFRMDLLACEPLVTSPVALAYDEDGRAFVLEMRDYPYTDKANDKAFTESTRDLPLGRVRLLRDADGDGVFDESKIYADNLSWPTGLALWKGGVFVAATPDLWYLKDTDGDGKADVREKVFTGFRKFNIQAVINNLCWGLDHRIYGAGGTNGGQVQSLKAPGTPAVTMGANDFRFDPRTPRFELLSGGARFGHSFDDWGNRFLCNIRNPVIHVVMPGEALARNPFAPVRSALHDAAAAGDTLPVYRASPPEPWRAVRARRWAAEGQAMPRSELVADGYFTSACGITIYRGAAYPEEYRGNAFLSDVAGNLIHREVLTPQGVTFKARRAEDRAEFVTSTDTWFRPVNFVNGPDGTLHVVDMYRETIEHPWSIPDEIKARLDLESGRDRGRIWRLAPPGFKPPPPPRLGKASTAELVACLENPNAWWRETAQRLIFERQDKSAVEPLWEVLWDSKYPLARLHAFWSLHGLGELTVEGVLAALSDQHAGVREHGVRLAEPYLARPDPGVVANKVMRLSEDVSVRVRFQVALALGAVKDERAILSLASVAGQDGRDDWVRAAILSAAGDRAGRLLETMLKDPWPVTWVRGRAVLRPLAQVVGARQDPKETHAVLALLARATWADRAWQTEVLLGLAEGLRQRGKSLSALPGASQAGLRDLLAQAIDEARTTAADSRAAVGRREQAAELLGLGDFAGARTVLTELLDPRQPAALQLAAVRVLSGFDDSQVSGLLLAGWRTHSPTVRGEVIQALLARPQRVGALLDAVEARHLAAADVPAARKAILLKHPDPTIRTRAAALLGGPTTGPRREVIARYEKALEGPADPARGRLVFRRACATCHRLGGEGFDVGPNLEAVRHHSPGQLLATVLDPNREVSPNYLEYLVTTRAGKVVTGVIAAETAAGITLRRAGGLEETVLRQDVEEMAGTNKSLMPDNLDQSVSPQELADVIALLLGPAPGAP